MFITIFCGILDTKSGEVWYTNAGHNPPFIIRSGKKPELLTGGKSTAIGLDENSVFVKEKLILQPEDTLCLYTDGVTEAFNEKGEQFQEERLIDVLSVHQKETSEELVKGVLGAIKLFSQHLPQSDDLTLMVLRYFPESKKYAEGLTPDTLITLRNDISEIQSLKDTWFKFARENNLSDQIIYDVGLALEEMVSNIIYYGYEDKKEHQIAVRLNLKNEKLVLEISDDGKEFNPLQYPQPDIKKPTGDREVGGLGIYIVRKIMDELQYHREPGKNILVMKMRLTK
jgi:sigma-B regulation protein RsbU (phosphoserine phosphatase)